MPKASLMPNLLLMPAMSKVPLIGGIAVRKVQPMLDVQLDYVELLLAPRLWLPGKAMTAADIMMSFPLKAAVSCSGLGPSRSATMAWLKTIHACLAY